MEPIRIELVYQPPNLDIPDERVRPFEPEAYVIRRDEPFDNVVRELIAISVRLLKLLPDPSLSPNERLERLARVVPSSQLVSAHRRTARAKLAELRNRLSELVPEPSLDPVERLEWLVARLDELVPGDASAITKLETIGDFRSADIGVSPWRWQ